MRRSSLAIGIAALLVPLAACANTGIGLLALAVPVTIVALLPAIVIEGPLLSRFLQVPWKRSLWVSCVANVASTLIGGVIAIATSFIPMMSGEFTREAVLISLVPMFFVTWWLENLVVRRMMTPDRKPRSKRATGLANAITYACMAIGVVILVPPESATFNRWRLSPALAELSAAKTDVSDHFHARGEFPPPKRFATREPTVKSLVLEPGGRLVVTLSFPGRPDGDGRHIVYEPVVTAGKLTAWKCSSPDVASRYLPAACR